MLTTTPESINIPIEQSQPVLFRAVLFLLQKRMPQNYPLSLDHYPSLSFFAPDNTDPRIQSTEQDKIPPLEKINP